MQQSKRFVFDYIFLTIWGIISGGFMYIVWFMFEKQGGILKEDGATTDVESFGVFNVIIMSLIAHLIILRQIRHWDLVYLGFFLFSIFWIPFDLWNESAIPDSRVYKSVGSYMLWTAQFDLSIVLVCAVIMLPLVLTWLRRTYWLEPDLYCVE